MPVLYRGSAVPGVKAEGYRLHDVTSQNTAPTVTVVTNQTQQCPIVLHKVRISAHIAHRGLP